MKKRVSISIVFALLILGNSLWSAGGPELLQNRQDITARQLQEMWNSYKYYDAVLGNIGAIYRAKLNNGVAPNRSILQGLAELTFAYLSEHPEVLDRPAEELVSDALKDLPRQVEEQKATWGKALEAAEAYFSQATPEHARAFFLALPDKYLPPIAFDQEILVIHIAFADGNFSLLEKNIDEGEPNAMDVGFRLINISDGANSEVLSHVLGGILLKHPRLFLDKIAFHLGNRSPKEFDGQLQYLLNPVAWWEIPEDDEDQTKYQALFKKNKELRIKALKSVENDDLENIRDRCLAILLAILEEIGN